MGRMGRGVGAQFDKMIRVYVEGSSDEAILKDWWFAPNWADHPSVEFRGPGQLPGGCEWVKRQVDARVDDLNEPPCFGIVDRDALARDPGDAEGSVLFEVFLDHENNALPTGTPLGDRIYVLRRWEIENYLMLDLECVFQEATHAPVARRPATVEQLGAMLMKDSEWLLTYAAGILHLRKISEKAPKAAFGCTIDTAADLRELFQQKYPDPEGNVPSFERRLARFAAAASSSVSEQWSAIQAIFDGKHLLQRFTARVMGRSEDAACVELAGRLAERAKDKVPGEIGDIVEDARRRGLNELAARAGSV